MTLGLSDNLYFRNVGSENPERIEFWLRELRTPELLSDIVKTYPVAAQLIASSRPVVQVALSSGLFAISQALGEEENEVRRRDRLYWEPLKRELEDLRRKRREHGQTKL
jgi:hypothetical protein